MFEDKDVAKDIYELMLEFRIKLSDSVGLVNKRCSEEEALRYKKAIGKVLGYMIYEIKEPICERYPELDVEKNSNE